MNAPYRRERSEVPEDRFTFDDVVRLSEQGYLPREGRIELVDGRIEIMPVDGDLHNFALGRLGGILSKAVLRNPDLERAWDVRIKATLKISSYHAREPDLMIVTHFDIVRPITPADVALIAETAVSSGERDLKEKRQAYAEARIAEYWVWDAEGLVLHVFRDPANGDYADQQTLRAGERASPLFAPQIDLAVDSLLPART